MNKIKAEILSLEKKLRACPDSKQKTIDKDIYNLLVNLTKEVMELHKKVKEQEEEIRNLKESED